MFSETFWQPITNSSDAHRGLPWLNTCFLLSSWVLTGIPRLTLGSLLTTSGSALDWESFKTRKSSYLSQGWHLLLTCVTSCPGAQKSRSLVVQLSLLGHRMSCPRKHEFSFYSYPIWSGFLAALVECYLELGRWFWSCLEACLALLQNIFFNLASSIM